MHIVGLQISNFKRIKAVAIHPDPTKSTIIIAGENAQGKSSILDGIWSTLGGGDASRDIPMPIREGQPKADVQIDLGEVVAIRSWTSNEQSYLKLKGKDGNPIASPQTLLDSWFGNLTFDPLAFSRLEPKKQREELLKISGVDQSAIDELIAEHNKIFMERTMCSRSVKDLEGQLTALPLLPDAPTEEIITEKIRNEATEAEKAYQLQSSDLRKFKENKAKIERLQQEIKELASENEVLVERWSGYQKPDIEGMWQKVKDADELNRKFEQNQKHLKVEQELLTRRQSVQGLTEALDKINERRIAILNAAAMPVAGLSVDEKQVYFNEIPFSQLSSAETLRVACAIAMAPEKKLKILLIRDASLLDKGNFAMIEAMAAERGYQIWMEVVGDADGQGTIIEDGMVKPQS